MDADAFLATAAAGLPSMVGDDLRIIDVRLDQGGDWLRAEARFEVRGTAVSGSAFVPFDEEWRYLSGYERVDDYAGLLADRVRSAARELMFPSARPTPATGAAEVASRWQWLLERLALNGQVVEGDDGSLRVVRGDDGGEFTVLVTPEQWAQIAEPIDPDSDDPQDFNQLSDEEAFLVFYENSLEWSVRAELPPVRYGAEIKRSFREAKERGEEMSRYGWSAAHGPDHPSSSSAVAPSRLAADDEAE